MWVRSLDQEDPMEEGMATHSCILALRIPWTEEPGGLQFIRFQRVRHNWSKLAHTIFMYIYLSSAPVPVLEHLISLEFSEWQEYLYFFFFSYWVLLHHTGLILMSWPQVGLKYGGWLPEKPSAWLERLKLSASPPDTGEGKGAGDWVHSPMTSDLINHVDAIKSWLKLMNEEF